MSLRMCCAIHQLAVNIVGVDCGECVVGKMQCSNS